MAVIVKPVTVTGAYFTKDFDYTEELADGEYRTERDILRITLDPENGNDPEYPLELEREATGDWPLGKNAWIIVTDDPQVLDVLCGATY